MIPGQLPKALSAGETRALDAALARHHLDPDAPNFTARVMLAVARPTPEEQGDADALALYARMREYDVPTGRQMIGALRRGKKKR